MTKNKGLKRFFEVAFVLIIAFAIIMIIFGILSVGFNFIYQSVGNVISEDVPASIRNVDWIIITAVTGFLVVYALEKMAKKGILKVKWD